MTGVPDDIQHLNNTHRHVRLAIRLWGAADQCVMSQVPMSIPWHKEYWNIQLKAHLKPHSIKSSNAPAWPYQLLVCMSLRSLGGNTSSKPQVSALIPRPAFNGMERMCQSHGSNQNSHPPVLVRKPLCNEFIHYHINSRCIFVLVSIVSNSVILLSLQ